MNKKQKIVFLVGLGIIVLMGLIPPWYFYSPNISTPGHYAFIFSSDTVYYEIGTNIDIIHLAIQWVVVAVATAGIMLVLKDDNARSQK
ncbi:MAG: hypothetical protein ABSA09_05455 [Desulfobaccales bacterium]